MDGWLTQETRKVGAWPAEMNHKIVKNIGFTILCWSFCNEKLNINVACTSRYHLWHIVTLLHMQVDQANISNDT